MNADDSKNSNNSKWRFLYLMEPATDLISTENQVFKIINDITNNCNTIPRKDLKENYDNLLKQIDELCYLSFRILFKININKISPRLFAFILILKPNIYELFSSTCNLEEVLSKISFILKENSKIKGKPKEKIIISIVAVQLGISPNTIAELECNKSQGRVKIAIKDMINALKDINTNPKKKTSKKNLDHLIKVLQRTLINTEKCAKILVGQKDGDSLMNIRNMVGTEESATSETTKSDPKSESGHPTDKSDPKSESEHPTDMMPETDANP